MVIIYQGYEIILEVCGKALERPVVLLENGAFHVARGFSDAIELINVLNNEEA